VGAASGPGPPGEATTGPTGPRLDHVGLTVRDLDASTAFYRDVAGFEVVVARFATGGPWFDTLTHNDGAAIEVAMLRLGAVTLQLVEYRAGGAAAGPSGHERVGNVHLSLEVDDLDTARDRVRRSGGDPTAVVDLPVPGRRSFYATDPDGTPVEFVSST